jgi:glycosyltransferase involved in cell wall biosynthesis
MPKVVHVVTTPRFAGVERYVADVARETAAHGWDVVVVGGDPAAMRRALAGAVRWRPGAAPPGTLLSLAREGRADICHAHMTKAEALAAATRPLHRAPVVATRHFAEPRGTSRLGALLAPWIGRALARQIAVSEFVAEQLEAPPDAVIPNAVRARPLLWRAESRIVLVLQRLEQEKDTLTALRAWRESGLGRDGWTLRIAGDGSERAQLEQWVVRNDVPAVEFVGWRDDPDSELAGAGLLLAPAPAEPAGIAVLEAMSAGVPVLAAAAGGHRETIGRLEGAPGFAPGNADEAATLLRALADTHRRSELSARVRATARAHITLAGHVERLLEQYRLAGAHE